MWWYKQVQIWVIKTLPHNIICMHIFISFPNQLSIPKAMHIAMDHQVYVIGLFSNILTQGLSICSANGVMTYLTTNVGFQGERIRLVKSSSYKITVSLKTSCEQPLVICQLERLVNIYMCFRTYHNEILFISMVLFSLVRYEADHMKMVNSHNLRNRKAILTWLFGPQKLNLNDIYTYTNHISILYVDTLGWTNPPEYNRRKLACTDMVTCAL